MKSFTKNIARAVTVLNFAFRFYFFPEHMLDLPYSCFKIRFSRTRVKDQAQNPDSGNGKIHAMEESSWIVC